MPTESREATTTSSTWVAPDDPHAQAMWDYLHGCYKPPHEYVRDDGWATVDSIERRFEDADDFRPAERYAFDLVSGPVLDVGCGAGKHILAWQNRGISAAGIDISPIAVDVCRRRNIRDVWVGDVLSSPAETRQYDFVSLFANGLSMGGSPSGVRRLLRNLHRIATPEGRVVLTNTDVSTSPGHRDQQYQQANLRAGRPRGLVRISSRYRGVTGRSYPWLFVSPDELTAWTADTGWSVEHVQRFDFGAYAAVLNRRPVPNATPVGHQAGER